MFSLSKKIENRKHGRIKQPYFSAATPSVYSDDGLKAVYCSLRDIP